MVNVEDACTRNMRWGTAADKIMIYTQGAVEFRVARMVMPQSVALHCRPTIDNMMETLTQTSCSTTGADGPTGTTTTRGTRREEWGSVCVLGYFGSKV